MSVTIFQDTIIKPHHTAAGEHGYAGKDTCLLEEDDVQCGHIFFNESSWLLKFFCTYCRDTYADINYFCEHLSEHMKSNGESDQASTPTLTEEDDLSNELTNVEMLSNTPHNSDYENEAFISTDAKDFDDDSMIVEELDEADEIATEVEEEMMHAFENDSIFLDDTSSSADFLGYTEDNFLPVEDSSQENTRHTNFQECFVKTAVVDIKDEEPVKNVIEKVQTVELVNEEEKPVKKRKVTTVKIIAAKNRIEELYAKIKLEEEKRFRENGSNIGNNDRLSTVDESEQNKLKMKTDRTESNADNTELESSTNESKEPKPVCKIIGETVITLLPEGSTKPPSAPSAPSPSTICDDTNISYVSPYHRNTNEKDCTCLACGKKFRSSFSLAIHKRTHYLETKSAIKLAHKCSDCDQLFNKLSEMKDHLQKVHYPEGFICKICNKKLTSLSLLEAHMRKVHLTRQFSCDMCKKNFHNREQFELHVSSHFGAQIFRCHICGRKYGSEEVLQQHMSNHKERVPQCCVVCGKMTLRITQHMKIHTPRPKRILSCSVCSKVFNFSSGLSHHFKVMHSQSRPPPKAKKENVNNAANVQKNSNSTDSSNPKLAAYKNVKEVEEKEEEAKRVIVELIKNASYTSFLPENYTNVTELTPPMAREETISAVNSIVDDC